MSFKITPFTRRVTAHIDIPVFVIVTRLNFTTLYPSTTLMLEGKVIEEGMHQFSRFYRTSYNCASGGIPSYATKSFAQLECNNLRESANYPRIRKTFDTDLIVKAATIPAGSVYYKYGDAFLSNAIVLNERTSYVS